MEEHKTAIVFYSHHHGNTRKLIDAIAERNEVDLIEVTKAGKTDLSGYDRIGFASGIYFGTFAKQVLGFAADKLPEKKEVFFLATAGVTSSEVFFAGIRRITDGKHCRFLGQYICSGFEDFGPFKVVGGIKKGHPDADEIRRAVEFYEGLR